MGSKAFLHAMIKYFAIAAVVIWGAVYLFSEYADFPMADCKDGTLSHSKHRSGTCSLHGGVLKWR